MTDQVQGSGEVQEQQAEKPQYSAVEQRALEMGWRPLEEFDGDEADFVDAKEFVGRRPLYEGLSSVKKQLKATQQALEALKHHHTKVKETEFQNALKVLKEQKKAALKEGEVDAFYELEERIESIESQKQEFLEEQKKISVDVPSVDPELQVWMSKNPWYTTSAAMRAHADEVGNTLAREVQMGRLTPQQALREIEKEVRKEFAHKFTNPNKEKAPSVEASTSRGSKSGDSFEMSEQERSVMNTLVRSKVMTKEEYIRDLKAAKGLK